MVQETLIHVLTLLAKQLMDSLYKQPIDELIMKRVVIAALLYYLVMHLSESQRALYDTYCGITLIFPHSFLLIDALCDALYFYNMFIICFVFDKL